MIRMTNKKDQAQQVIYVDRPSVEHIEVTKTEYITSEPEIHTVYVDREVIKEVPVQVDKLIIQKELEVVDLTDIQTHLSKHDDNFIEVIDRIEKVASAIQPELEMQRRALVAIKQQRDIDRNRRLMLIRRIKKERDAHKKNEFKFKLAIAASFLLSLASLIVKL